MSPFGAVRVDETCNSVHETQDLWDLKDASCSVQVLDHSMILIINMPRIMTLWKHKLKLSE